MNLCSSPLCGKMGITLIPQQSQNLIVDTQQLAFIISFGDKNDAFVHCSGYLKLHLRFALPCIFSCKSMHIHIAADLYVTCVYYCIAFYLNALHIFCQPMHIHIAAVICHLSMVTCLWLPNLNMLQFFGSVYRCSSYIYTALGCQRLALN